MRQEIKSFFGNYPDKVTKKCDDYLRSLNQDRRRKAIVIDFKTCATSATLNTITEALGVAWFILTVIIEITDYETVNKEGDEQ